MSFQTFMTLLLFGCQQSSKDLLYSTGKKESYTCLKLQEGE